MVRETSRFKVVSKVDDSSRIRIKGLMAADASSSLALLLRRADLPFTSRGFVSFPREAPIMVPLEWTPSAASGSRLFQSEMG